MMSTKQRPDEEKREYYRPGLHIDYRVIVSLTIVIVDFVVLKLSVYCVTDEGAEISRQVCG